MELTKFSYISGQNLQSPEKKIILSFQKSWMTVDKAIN